MTTTPRPALSDPLSRYLNDVYPRVDGWLDPLALVGLDAVQRVHEELGIEGSIIEIGVHHGRFFLALDRLRRPGEPAVAIDAFGEQSLNIDGSGRGDLDVFLGHVRRFGARGAEGLRALQTDSLHLGPRERAELAEPRCRLFSVDGGHTAVHAAADLRLAADVLAPGGVVFLDDAFKPSWPGVHEGMSRVMLLETPRIAPFGFLGNKLLFTTVSHQSLMAERFHEHVSADPLLGSKPVEMFGWPVAAGAFNRSALLATPAEHLRDPERSIVQSGPAACVAHASCPRR